MTLNQEIHFLYEMAPSTPPGEGSQPRSRVGLEVLLFRVH